MTISIPFTIIAYLVIGIAYAIDFFYTECEEMLENEGMQVGRFFGLTILTGLIWPLCIIMLALMDIRNER